MYMHNLLFKTTNYTNMTNWAKKQQNGEFLNKRIITKTNKKNQNFVHLHF